jgi:hypothetical protein
MCSNIGSKTWYTKITSSSGDKIKKAICLCMWIEKQDEAQAMMNFLDMYE